MGLSEAKSKIKYFLLLWLSRKRIDGRENLTADRRTKVEENWHIWNLIRKSLQKNPSRRKLTCLKLDFKIDLVKAEVWVEFGVVKKEVWEEIPKEAAKQNISKVEVWQEFGVVRKEMGEKSPK